MERKILRSEKNIFWEALLIAVFIFLVGLLIGIFLENSRAEVIQDLYFESELRLFDLRIQSQLFELEDLSCDYAILKNIEFGDKVFEEAFLLKDFEDSEELTEQDKKEIMLLKKEIKRLWEENKKLAQSIVDILNKLDKVKIPKK